MDVDRISGLPDRLIQHILSFLQTRRAAQTSLLSKRWRHMWEYAPALDFETDLGKERRDEVYERWPPHALGKSVVQHVISQHKSSSLRRFRPCAYGYVEGKDVEYMDKLMALVIRCKVEELHLSVVPREFMNFYGPNGYRLPNGIFSSGHLRVLELRRCGIADIGTLNLARVEILSLDSIHASDEVYNHLISSCKSLKELNLFFCVKVSHLDLCLQELRMVVIIYCPGLRKFIVDAPKLQHVEVGKVGERIEFSLRNSLDLKSVKLQLWNDKVSNFNDIVRGLSSPKCLKIYCSFWTSKPPPLESLESCQSFYNIKQLELNIRCYKSSVVDILNLLPNLEELIIIFQKENANSKDEDNCSQHFSVHCLKHSLRRIELRNFLDLDCYIRLAEFLVKHAAALENMCLTKCYGSLKRILETKSKLELISASKTAKISCT